MLGLRGVQLPCLYGPEDRGLLGHLCWEASCFGCWTKIPVSTEKWLSPNTSGTPRVAWPVFFNNSIVFAAGVTGGKLFDNVGEGSAILKSSALVFALVVHEKIPRWTKFILKHVTLSYICLYSETCKDHHTSYDLRCSCLSLPLIVSVSAN